MSKIMPCPCCGSETARQYTHPSSGLVMCGDSCGMIVRGRSTSEAIQSWNRLALAVQVAEALEWNDECQMVCQWAKNMWNREVRYKELKELDEIVLNARGNLNQTRYKLRSTTETNVL